MHARGRRRLTVAGVVVVVPLLVAAASLAPVGPESVRGLRPVPVTQDSPVAAMLVHTGRTSVWTWLTGEVEPGVVRHFSEACTDTGAGDEQAHAARLAAAAAALRARANDDVTGLRQRERAVVVSGAGGQGLRAGDEVLEVDGATVDAVVAEEWLRGDLGRGRAFVVTVQRCAQRVDVSVDRSRTLMVTLLAGTSPVPVSSGLDGVKGPSVGLALTLAWIDETGPGTLATEPVAVTGAVTPLPGGGAEAGVAPVLAVADKAQAAAAAGYRLLIVPAAQVQAAEEGVRRAGVDGVEVVGVEWLSDAVRALCLRGGQDPVCGQVDGWAKPEWTGQSSGGGLLDRLPLAP